MRLIKICSILILITLNVKAQSYYQTNLIQRDLLTRTSAVVRNMNLSIEVKDLDNVTYRYKTAITILNSNGDDAAAIQLWYNKSMQVKSVKGIIYDEFSKPTSKFSLKEFKDVSAANNFSLFEDSRVKIYRPAVTSYPYTIEYEYEIHAKHSMYFPDWFPKNSSGISVEQASFHFSSGLDYTIRYKETNYKGEAVKITESEKLRSYTWEMKNIKASRFEPYSQNSGDLFTSVRIAPNTFKYMGVAGSFSNWNEMGTWMSEKLLKGRNTIPDVTAAYIKDLTKNIADPKLKAKKIYEYVQQKTRYISVQIGIGGFQPIKAEDVDRTGYGDCKGLANYTQGLLKVAEIDSYYAVIYGDDRKHSPYPDFASMDQFNHAILCIPFRNDTTWIDCTSKENPFGYLGNFTDDRLALICTESGGKLIRTPTFKEDKSLQNRKANFTISANGDLAGDMTTTFEGSQYDNREMLINEPYTEQLKKLPEIYSIDNMEIDLFQLKQNKTINPATTEILKLKARDYATMNEKLLYIPINMVNGSRPAKEVSNRINSVYINRGYTDIDEINYTFPQNFKVDSAPQNFSVEYPFGKYNITVEVKGNIIKYIRKMQINAGLYSSEKYQDLVSFFQSATDADNQKITLIAQ